MKEKVILYHGSYGVVERPNLAFCSKGKDFGCGFYLTTSLDQAKNFVKTSIKKAMNRGLVDTNCNHGFVNVYECELDDSLRTIVFENADLTWLHCVAAHRSEGVFPGEVEKWQGYDLICGEIAIGFLEPENLVDQWCFRSAEALRSLKFVRADRL